MKQQLLLVPILFFCSFLAYPHGYVKSPESRSYLCRKEVNTNCGQIQYEPQSLEGPKGFPQQGPADGEIASAGLSQFSPLDVQTAERWKTVPLKTRNVEFEWYLTAKHKTTKWEYFMTKPDWEPNIPLSRAQFELTPFCEFHRIETPDNTVKHNCVLPQEQTGYQVVLAVWTIDDTSKAFYQVIDLSLN